jgi:predicted transcriptional regulator
MKRVELSRMTKLLREVMRKVSELPDERQNDAARVLLTMLESDVSSYQLSDEQRREVDRAVADVDGGQFANEADVAEVLHNSWA